MQPTMRRRGRSERSQTASVRTAVRQGEGLARQARSDVVGGRYAAARVKLRRAKALTSAALSDFGVPLERDFPAFVTTRENVDYAGAPIYDKDAACCTGLSALVSRDIAEVVIGAADRRTANAGERGAASRRSPGLPIFDMGPAFLVEASGRYTTNHCSLKSGLITCRLYSPMPADKIFMIAVEPALPKGTKLLVKFRSPNGDRSYSSAYDPLGARPSSAHQAPVIAVSDPPRTQRGGASCVASLSSV